MTKYFDRINTVLTNTPDMTPDVLFVKLLYSYQDEADSVVSRKHHQFFTGRLIQTIAANGDQADRFELWKIIADFINKNLPLHRLDVKGDFAQLLNTFLGYYPPLKKLLAADVKQHLSSSPYQFSLQKEINRLCRQLYMQTDTLGITTDTFVNFMLFSSKETQASIIEELLAQRINDESLSFDIKLQIGMALARLSAILTAPQIANILSTLFSQLRPPIAEKYRLKISNLLSALAPHLTEHTQYLLLEVSRSNIEHKKYHEKILKNLAPAIPYLSGEVAATLVNDLLLWARKAEKNYSLLTCDILYGISSRSPTLINKVIQEKCQDEGYYQANDFLILGTLMQSFPEALLIMSINKLLTILQQGAFKKGWEMYSAEDRNTKACHGLIIKLFGLLDQPAKQLIDQEMIERAMSNEENYKLHNFLILFFQGRKVAALYDLALHLAAANNDNSNYTLRKVLELMLENKQDDLLENYLNVLLAKPYSACSSTIWYICSFFSKLNPELKLVFAQGIKTLFMKLSDEDKFSLLESLGFHDNPEIKTALQTIKAFANFYHSRMLPKLTSKTLSMLKSEISQEQQAVIVRQLLSKAAPVSAIKDDDNDDDHEAATTAHKKNADIYISICLLAEHLDWPQRMSALTTLIAYAMISTSNFVIHNNHNLITACVHCINVSLSDSPSVLLGTIIPLVILTTQNKIPDFMRKLLQGLPSQMQKFLIEKLAEPKDDSAHQELFYSLLSKTLEALPKDSETYYFALDKILALLHSQRNIILDGYLLNCVTRVMPDDKRLTDIFYHLLDEPAEPAVQTIGKLVVASSDKNLIRRHIYVNIRKLLYPKLYSNACQNLLALSPKMGAESKVRLAEALVELFEESYLLIKVGTHPHAFNNGLFIGHPEMFLAQLLDLVPKTKWAIIKDLINRFQFDDSISSLIISRALAGLYESLKKDFNAYTTTCTLAWITRPHDPAKFLLVRKLVHHGLYDESVMGNIAGKIPAQTMAAVIRRITRQINSGGTNEIKTYSENLLFGIFSMANLAVKNLIVTKLTALTLKSDFRLTPALQHAFHTITTKIYSLREASAMRFHIEDAYANKLMKLAESQNDDGRKILLHMLSNLYYEASVRPWLQKKLNNSTDLTNHIMRFLI
jgi:hypothetical protein